MVLALGKLGICLLRLEIAAQEQSITIAFDSIVLANGSSGTHAGLLAGCELSGSTAKAIAYNVLKPVADICLLLVKLHRKYLICYKAEKIDRRKVKFIWMIHILALVMVFQLIACAKLQLD